MPDTQLRPTFRFVVDSELTYNYMAFGEVALEVYANILMHYNGSNGS